MDCRSCVDEVSDDVLVDTVDTDEIEVVDDISVGADRETDRCVCLSGCLSNRLAILPTLSAIGRLNVTSIVCLLM